MKPVSREPPQASVSLDAIVSLAQSGQVEAASQACDAALRAEPEAPELLHLRGLLYTLSNKPGAAIPFLERAIGHQPRAKYWSNLGNAFSAIGRGHEAERAYRSAIALDANFGDAWFNLGKLLLHGERVLEAAEALEQVTRLHPADGQAWKILGDSYQRFGQFAEARAAYEKALELSPSDADLAALVADSLEKENRLDEARRMVDAALALQPEHAVANLVAAILERRAGRPAEARARLLAMPGSRLPVAVLVRREHELGVLDDRAGIPGAAFDHFARAKALLASDPRYERASGPRYLARLDRLIELEYSWLRRCEPVSDDGVTDPAFIVGFPRSGTTLLNQILYGHPELHVMEESPLLMQLEDRLPAMQPGYPLGLAARPDAELRELRRQYFGLAGGAHPDWDGKKRLVDKLPLNITRLPLIARLFPRAQVLLVLRHPYDACLSGFMQLFDPNDAMANFADLQSAALLCDRIFRLWDKVSPHLPVRWMPTKYEDLITDQEGQTRAITGFLGVPWTAALMHHSESVARRGYINTPSYQQVARPVHRESLARWVAYARYFEPLQPLLRRHLEAWGYQA